MYTLLWCWHSVDQVYTLLWCSAGILLIRCTRCCGADILLIRCTRCCGAGILLIRCTRCCGGAGISQETRAKTLLRAVANSASSCRHPVYTFSCFRPHSSVEEVFLFFHTQVHSSREKICRCPNRPKLLFKHITCTLVGQLYGLPGRRELERIKGYFKSITE